MSVTPPSSFDINMKLSRKRRRLRPLLSAAATMAIVYSSGTLAANCKFQTDETTVTINFGKSLTNGLTIPQDAPNGTVIYQDPIDYSPTKTRFFSCSYSFPYGFFLNPALGSALNGSIFPLGQTGLSFRIRGNNAFGDYLTAPQVRVPADYYVPDGTYILEIIKSGELPLQNKVPSGFLGKFRAEEAVFVIFNLLNPITLNTASCQTPAVSVQMGDDYRLDEFTKSGDTPRVIKFNIALNQCQRGIQKVTYSLKASTQVIDAQKGIVALNAGSTAKGIGLQLMNEAGQPIALDTTYPFSAFNTTGTDFTIPLSAAYYRLAEGKLEAGTANTEMTFIVNYL